MNTKASAANASKSRAKASIRRRRASTEPRPPKAAAEGSEELEQEPSMLNSTQSVAERVEAQREQLFKVISIVQCCRNAMATKLVTYDLEYMIPAFEAVCDLLDNT